jgi:hypothetical protein
MPSFTVRIALDVEAEDATTAAAIVSEALDRKTLDAFNPRLDLVTDEEGEEVEA